MSITSLMLWLMCFILFCKHNVCYSTSQTAILKRLHKKPALACLLNILHVIKLVFVKAEQEVKIVYLKTVFIGESLPYRPS